MSWVLQTFDRSGVQPPVEDGGAPQARQALCKIKLAASVRGYRSTFYSAKAWGKPRLRYDGRAGQPLLAAVFEK